ncbi:hypothetical protein ACW95P_02650 [Candidatus Mycoplasma pogonae]
MSDNNFQQTEDDTLSSYTRESYSMFKAVLKILFQKIALDIIWKLIIFLNLLKDGLYWIKDKVMGKK